MRKTLGTGLTIGLAAMMAAPAYADPATDAKVLGRQALEKFGGTNNPQALSDQLKPLTSDVPIFSVDGTASASGKIGCAGAEQAIIALIQFDAGNELKHISAAIDADFDGTVDHNYVYDEPSGSAYGVGGMCMNGFIACSPKGSWSQMGANNCTYYGWQYDETTGLTATPVSASSLHGCFCFNASCMRLPTSYLNIKDQILKAIGAGIVSAVGSQDPKFAVDQGKISNTMIEFFGTSTKDCFDNSQYNFTGLGSTDPSSFLNFPNTLASAGQNAITAPAQIANPFSLPNLMSGAYDQTSQDNLCSEIRDFRCPGASLNTNYYVGTGACPAGPMTPTVSVNWTVANIILGDGTTLPARSGSASYNVCFDQWLWGRIGLAGNLPTFSWTSTPALGTPDGGSACGVGEYTVATGLTAADLPAGTAYYKASLEVAVTGSGCNAYLATLDSGGAVINRLDFEYCNNALNLYTTNTCTTLANDPNCRLKGDTVYDASNTPVNLFSNFQGQGVAATSSCKTDVFGFAQCFPWWKRDRVYECLTNTPAYTIDASGPNAVLGSLSGGGPYTYTDASGVTGSITALLNPSSNACVKSCKVTINDMTGQAYSVSNNTMIAQGQITTDTNTQVSIFRKCDIDPTTGAETCPYDPALGETLVSDCGCLDNFATVAPAFEIVDWLQTDKICSDGTKKK